MNKKLILVLILVSVFSFLVYKITKPKDAEVFVLTSTKGLKITVPIQFSADEKVTAVDFTVTGEILSVECTSAIFIKINAQKFDCAMANFDGGSISGVVGRITFVENNNTKPVVSGFLGNSNGDSAKNGKFYIEY